jgi:DNA-directed RNA polymerase specialized sigma24 family protein
MTIIPFPARSARRYGDPVVTQAMSLEDEQDDAVRALAARLVSGEEGALEEIYDRWSALVHTYALRALHDQHDAEDVTQQVFVSAWRSRHTLTPSPTALPAWLLGIARHKVSDVRAARARDADRVAAVVSLPGAHDGSDPSADDDVAERLVWYGRPSTSCRTRAAPSCSSPSGRDAATPRSPRPSDCRSAPSRATCAVA